MIGSFWYILTSNALLSNRCASHQTMIGKTVITSISCQDDMILDLDIKKYCGLLDLFGQLFIGFTSLQLPDG